MSKLLKATLFLLGAYGLLLLAGGFPLAGAPEVYKSGLMLLLAGGIAFVSLWGAWRLSSGMRRRFAVGLGFLFLTCVGVVAAWKFGGMSLVWARQGGPMWFGAVAMACMALVGLLFCAIYGFFTLRLLTRRLWLAAVHACALLVLGGAWADYVGGEQAQYHCLVGKEAAVPQWNGKLSQQPPFSIRVTQFDVLYYGEPSYSLFSFENGQPVLLGTPELRGDTLVLGEESWALASAQHVPGMPYLVLPGKPARLLLSHDRPVKEYRAECLLTLGTGEHAEERRETLRVNEPISCEGWMIYLMNYSPQADGAKVVLMLRRAPGRIPALLGMVALILCTAGWCFSPNELKK